MDVSRRHILAGLGVVPLGGCSGILTSGSGIQLGGLRVTNSLEETHTVDMVLERGESRVYQEVVEVDVDDQVWTDPDWSSEPAEYDLYYTVSGSDEVSIAQLTRSIVPSNIVGECVFANLLLSEGPHGSIVSLSSIEEVEGAECNF